MCVVLVFIGFLGFSGLCAHTSGASRGVEKVVWSWSWGLVGVIDYCAGLLLTGKWHGGGRGGRLVISEAGGRLGGEEFPGSALV